MPKKLTTAESHVATAKGYAAGQLIEEGQRVPPGIPVGSWMAETGEAEAVVDAAAEVAKFDHDGDGRPGGSRPKK